MNDYLLINFLLEDGSESSLMKLKMIVDFDNFNTDNIKQNNITRFLFIFKEYYIEKIKNSPEIISKINKLEIFEVINVFKESLSEGFKNEPYTIGCFDKDCQIEIIQMFKEIFINQFNSEYNDIILHFINDSNKLNIVLNFKDLFYNKFLKNPKLIYCFTKYHQQRITELFPDIRFVL